LRELKSRLEKHNVPYTLIREGAVPLIKISGVLYEAVPYTKQYRMPSSACKKKSYAEDKVICGFEHCRCEKGESHHNKSHFPKHLELYLHTSYNQRYYA